MPFLKWVLVSSCEDRRSQRGIRSPSRNLTLKEVGLAPSAGVLRCKRRRKSDECSYEQG